MDPLQFFIDTTGRSPTDRTRMPGNDQAKGFGEALDRELASQDKPRPRPVAPPDHPHLHATRYGFYRAPLEAPATEVAAEQRNATAHAAEPVGQPAPESAAAPSEVSAKVPSMQVLGEAPQQPATTPTAPHPPRVTRYGFYRAPLEDPRATSHGASPASPEGPVP